MTIGERIIRGLGGATVKEVRDSFREGYASGYADGGEDEPPSGDLRRMGYRRATTTGLRDFTQIDRERIIEIVWTLFQSNPVADRAMEIKRDYIIGRGIQFQARDNRLQKILDAFWRDNKMHMRAREYTLQLFLFGVQCLPVFVRKTDGRVRLGYIDPSDIEDVIPHPENAQEMWAVVVKSATAMNPWERHLDRRVYRIIRTEEDLPEQFDGWLKGWESGARPESEEGEGELVQPFYAADQDQEQEQGPHIGKLVTAAQAKLEKWETEMLKAFGLEEYSGTVFYVKVNSVSNQPHGYSDLLQVADWLDQQDETLFALADREQWANYFSWDVTLKGANENTVKSKATELRKRAPRRGSVNVHNDSEEWRMDYPSLQQSGSIETARAIQNHAFGGLGFPEAWFGRGDETNRATLQAQGDPTWRTLEHDQDVVREFLSDLLAFVRDQAEIAGEWQPKDPERLVTPGGDGRLSMGEAAPTISLGSIAQIMKGDDEKGGPEEVELDVSEAEAVDPREITITMPEMTARDLSLVAGMLSTVAGALVIAEEQQWQDKAQSVEVWAKALNEFGVELDVAAIQKALERKEQETELERGGAARYGTSTGLPSSAVGRHGVMLAGDEDEDEEPGELEWAGLSRSNREALLAAFLESVGIERTLEDVSAAVEALEGGAG